MPFVGPFVLKKSGLGCKSQILVCSPWEPFPVLWVPLKGQYLLLFPLRKWDFSQHYMYTRTLQCHYMGSPFFVFLESGVGEATSQTLVRDFGINVSIPCPEVKDLADTFQVHKLDWYCRGCASPDGTKSSNDEKIVTFDSQGTVILRSPERISLSSNNFSLQISSTRLSDAGEFYCLVNDYRQPSKVFKMIVQGKAHPLIRSRLTKIPNLMPWLSFLQAARPVDGNGGNFWKGRRIVLKGSRKFQKLRHSCQPWAGLYLESVRRNSSIWLPRTLQTAIKVPLLSLFLSFPLVQSVSELDAEFLDLLTQIFCVLNLHPLRVHASVCCCTWKFSDPFLCRQIYFLSRVSDWKKRTWLKGSLPILPQFLSIEPLSAFVWAKNKWDKSHPIPWPFCPKTPLFSLRNFDSFAKSSWDTPVGPPSWVVPVLQQ